MTVSNVDPILAGTKLIAEAWDAAGLYQVGSFPAYGRWAEWKYSAMEDAVFVSKFATDLDLVHRREEFRASKIMQERALENDKIDFAWHSVVDEVLGDDTGVTGVRVAATDGSGTRDIEVAGLFIAVGHIPNTQIFAGQLDMNGGYINIHSGTDGYATATSVEGVFAAGDVADHVYRQAVTSAGTGCMAALDAERYLDDIICKDLGNC